jgi:transposase-like protein
MGCSSSLLVRWVREFAQNLRWPLQKAEGEFADDKAPDIIEMDETYTRIKKGHRNTSMDCLFSEKR